MFSLRRSTSLSDAITDFRPIETQIDEAGKAYLAKKARIRESSRHQREPKVHHQAPRQKQEISDQKAKENQIGLNWSVVISHPILGRRQYRLVESDKADIKTNQISIQSPIGRALLGHTQEGEKIIVDSPSGQYEIELISFTPSP